MSPKARQCVANLTVLAVLLGNFAGFVHVGCHQQGPPATIAEAGDSAGPAAGHGHCCQHGCGAVPTAPSDEGPADDEHDSEPSDHDSDRCCICQNYLCARAGVLPVVDAPVLLPVPRELAVCLASRPSPAAVMRGYSQRGPPSVA